MCEHIEIKNKHIYIYIYNYIHIPFNIGVFLRVGKYSMHGESRIDALTPSVQQVGSRAKSSKCLISPPILGPPKRVAKKMGLVWESPLKFVDGGEVW